MNATELATVVEGWATLAGLLVVIAGATFAGVQLRAEAREQRFQTVMAVLTQVRSLDIRNDWDVMVGLPDGFDMQQLPPEQFAAVRRVHGSYTQLGNLLAAGFVREKDIFSFLGVAQVGIASWEKSKHLTRANEARGQLPPRMFHEYFAARAESYLDRHGLEAFGRIPHFDSDPSVNERLAKQVSEARSTAAT